MKSSANLCVNCHQPYEAPPVADSLGMFTVPSTHYGPHHGPQSVVLEGLGGIEIAGSMEYPGTKAHPHRKMADCTSCHLDGMNHKFAAPEISVCKTCHTTATDFNIGNKLTDLNTLAEEVATLLDQTGITSGGHVVAGTYPVKLASCFWNYSLFEEDKSEGIHNPDYMEALLTNTKEALEEIVAAQ